MSGLLLWVGRLAGLAGVLLCGVAAAVRLSGGYQLGAYQALTVLDAGTALMVMGALAYAAALAESPTMLR